VAQMSLRIRAQAPDSGSASIFRVGSETASRTLPGTKPGAGGERAVAVARAVAPPVAGAGRERDGIGIVGCGGGGGSEPPQPRYVRARAEGQNGPFTQGLAEAGARATVATGRGARMTGLPLDHSASTWSKEAEWPTSTGRGRQGLSEEAGLSLFF
jgi:hypothetical protein